MNLTRALRSFASHLGVSIGATVIAVAVSLIIVAVSGHPIDATVGAFLDGALGSPDQAMATVETMIPLVLIGAAWIVAFSAGQINIGLEGQILIGGVAAAAVGLAGSGMPRWVHLPLAIGAGVLGGAAYAGIAAWLHIRRNVSLVIATFMLNFIAALIVNWLIRGPLQDQTNTSVGQSASMPASATWPHFGTGELAWDVLLIPVAVAAVFFVQHYTTFGFRLRLLGANTEAARYAGVEVNPVKALAILISGGIAGIVGSSLILAPDGGSVTDNFSSNYGFQGVVVALLARNSVVGCVPAAFLLAALTQGGSLAQSQVGIPAALVQVIEGILIILIGGSVLLVRRLPAREPRPKPSATTVLAGEKYS